MIATSIAFGIMLSVARHAVRITDTKADQRKETESLPEDARAENPMLSSSVQKENYLTND